MSADSNGNWPDELLFLLERHPRANWPSARSATAAFWLDVHERLRRDAAGLEAAGDDYRRGGSSPVELAVIAAPRLRGLVAAMHGHHQIEDFEYFPEFRREEPRLAGGFDRLEREHTSLNRSVDAALAALGELRAAAERSATAPCVALPRASLPSSTEPAATAVLKLAAQRYVDAAATLTVDLLRHLRDEENLVVPLLLERGDY